MPNSEYRPCLELKYSATAKSSNVGFFASKQARFQQVWFQRALQNTLPLLNEKDFTFGQK